MTEILRPMFGARRKDILEYGVRVLLSGHQNIRKLKRHHSPAFHGFRVWPSSWLLMDFFKNRGMPADTRVMEVGCGWGLAGIYCAKRYGALVTGVDKDPEVFPYLRLHAELNDVKINEIRKTFSGLTKENLNGVDVVIGADICFWDTLIDPLIQFIGLALGSGVKLVVIADPGRASFEDLETYCVGNMSGEALGWEVIRPHPIQGRILKIGSLMQG
ncbi:MAG: methyltransferase [Deltaproteobacteria bacterium]|nr:methyltransferase [Deltaproteobacteria bacterium]